MRTIFARRCLTISGIALLAIATVGAGFAYAAGPPSGPPKVVYVSPRGTHAGRACAEADYTSINAAIHAVAPGGTVNVCAGRYHEDAVVSKRLTLVGVSKHVVIDAAGVPEVVPGAGSNGVTVLASHTVVSNLKVVNGSGDGLLIGGVNYVHVSKVTASKNHGFGIDIESSSHITITQSLARANGAGGINITDDLGKPAFANALTDNRANDNKNGCGIVLADHSGAGVFSNTISGNTVNGNGLHGAGAGIMLASPIPGGTVRNNLVTSNAAEGNGLAGITIHSHLAGQNLNGNVVTRNVLAKNNVQGDDPGIDSPTNKPDNQTTGVLIATVGPLSIKVNQNVIRHDHFGVWTLGPVAYASPHLNNFFFVNVHEFAA